MQRRDFLRLFGRATAAIGATSAMPEVLKKVVEFAADEGISTSYDEVATLAEINAIAIKHILPGIEDYIFRPSPILAYMKRQAEREPEPFAWRSVSPRPLPD